MSQLHLPKLDTHFREDFLRATEAVDCCWYSTVNRRLQKHFLNIFLAEAVINGAFYMELELMWPIEGGNHGEVDDASGATI